MIGLIQLGCIALYIIYLVVATRNDRIGWVISLTFMFVGSIVLNVILIYLMSFLLDRCYIDRIEHVCNTYNGSKLMDKGMFAQVDDEMKYVAVDIKKLNDIEDNRNNLGKYAEELNDVSIISTDTGREY